MTSLSNICGGGLISVVRSCTLWRPANRDGEGGDQRQRHGRYGGQQTGMVKGVMTDGGTGATENQAKSVVKFTLRDETHFIFVKGLKVELTGGLDAVLVGRALLMGGLQGVMGGQEVWRATRRLSSHLSTVPVRTRDGFSRALHFRH